MMTLDEARELATPILKSKSFLKRETQKKIQEIRNMFGKDFDFSDGKQILALEKEKAFRELIAMHKGIDIFA